MQPVRIEGAAELRRSLKALKPEFAVELRKAEAQAAQVISQDAAARAPRGTRPLPKNRRLRLHEAIRPLVRGTRIYVGATYRTAPHGNVNHWGGTIRPKGAPIRFVPRKFILQARAAKLADFVELLDMALTTVINRHF